jgi:hypothetical protein
VRRRPVKDRWAGFGRGSGGRRRAARMAAAPHLPVLAKVVALGRSDAGAARAGRRRGRAPGGAGGGGG